MFTAQTSYSGLDALLTPEESVLLLVDHQGFQFANLHSHEPQLVVNNVVALAKTAKVFGVPDNPHESGSGGARRLHHQGYPGRSLEPNRKPINRTFINAWQDSHHIRESLARRYGRRK